MKPKKKNRMLTDLARFGHGFVYAWHGICAAVLEERNFRFHLCAALYVFAAAHMAHIDATGVALLAICVFMMLGMELMNSAVERAVDKPDTTHWWSAGAAKDMAAGGVLVTAFGAVVVGICLFGNAAALNAIWTSVTGNAAQHGALGAFAGAGLPVHLPPWQAGTGQNPKRK